MSDKKVGLIMAGIVVVIFGIVWGGCFALAQRGFVPDAVIFTVKGSTEPAEAETAAEEQTEETEPERNTAAIIDRAKQKKYCCEDKKSLGAFRITVYTPFDDNGRWGYATATREKSKHLATCAVDPDVIPLGTVIEVGGYRLLAADTGSAVKGRVIDIFYDGTVAEAAEWVDSHFGSSTEVYGWDK